MQHRLQLALPMLAALMFSPCQAAWAASSCTDLRGLSLPGAAVSIERAQEVAGTVGPPIGATAAGDTPALARGFAVVSSDSGHEVAIFDSSFFADQQAALDFLYQSIGKVMAVARPLLAAYYGQPARHSYFVGCSTGGREAMVAAQRYPDEFDGIVAGSPAMRTNYSNLALRWITTVLNAAAPRDPQGRPLTAETLSPSDRKLVVDALLQSCDALDGVRDGMIFAARHCAFDPQILQCRGPKADSCLSGAFSSNSCSLPRLHIAQTIFRWDLASASPAPHNALANSV